MNLCRLWTLTAKGLLSELVRPTYLKAIFVHKYKPIVRKKISIALCSYQIYTCKLDVSILD